MSPELAPTAEINGLREQVGDLQARLDEATETLRALAGGEVDAIVAAGPDGDRVYTLKGADEAYRVMVEEMGEGALTLSSDGLILFSNQYFAAMLGRPLERVMGSRLQEFVASDDAGLVSALLGNVGRSKAEVRLFTEAAVLIPVYISIQNVFLDGIWCRCAIITDLSEQKRHAEIAAVLEAAPAGVFIGNDAACRRVLGNRRAWEMLRLQSPDNSAKTTLNLDQLKKWRKLREGRDIPPDELPLQTAARTGRRVDDYEFDVLVDDGVYRCWLGNAVPLFDEAGRPRGSVGVFLDITERRENADALEAASAELRKFGEALTDGLRGPLSMLVTSARLLEEEHRGRISAHADEFISDTLRHAQKIETLLQALLDYRGVMERSGLHMTPVDCGAVLSQTLEHLGREIETNVATVTAGPLPTVAADEPLLGQLFRTLIGNAIQYRGEAAPVIRISAENAGDRWLFSVQDNGMGIEQRHAESIFGMFQRLHGDEIPGTGIGLPLCRKIVERHGGRLWVESVFGMGAAFRFTIPISLDPSLPPPEDHATVNNP